MNEFDSRQEPLLSYRRTRKARVDHLTNSGGDQSPALTLRHLSTAAKLINVPTADERLDLATYVDCYLPPLRCRKQAHLLHSPQEANCGSTHKKRTPRHSLPTMLTHAGLRKFRSQANYMRFFRLSAAPNCFLVHCCFCSTPMLVRSAAALDGPGPSPEN